MITNKNLAMTLLSAETAQMLKQRGGLDELPRISAQYDFIKEEFIVFWKGKQYFITNVSPNMFQDSLDSFSARILQPLVGAMLQPENMDD